MKIKLNPARITAGFIIACIISFVACKKETSATSQAEDTTFANLSTESAINADAVFTDVFNNVIGVNDEVAFGGTGVFSRVGSADSSANKCFTVTVTRLSATDLFPVKTVTDFGTGCTDQNGITRKGKIITIYSGRLIVPGNVAETSFEDYYINAVHVEGKHRIQNISSSQVLAFKVDVTDSKITKANGNYTEWTSDYTISQTEGSGTPAWLKDDAVSITGAANGEVKNDSIYLVWNSKIIEPLIKRFNCQWIASGKVGIGKTSTDAAIIDYGDGTCDNKASIIINGVAREITLH